jgi:hypothetical protein
MFRLERRQSKQTVKDGQPKSLRFIKTADREGFGKRLREAFGGAKNVEIAERLGKSEPAIKNYIDGRIPQADDLVVISSLTGCSVHWLVTGEGPKEVLHVDHRLPKQKTGAELSPEVRTAIRQEIIGVLGGLLLSDSDRELADSLLGDLRRNFEKGMKC